MKKNKIDIITMGCSKNLVDTEQLIKQLLVNGYTVEHEPETLNGEIVVVNTCGFIGDAREQSINKILEAVDAKQKRKVKKVIVMGCLSERYLDELRTEIPEVDAFYGKFGWKQLISDLGKSFRTDLALERGLTTPKHYAYLKISEGCNRKCSYCSIPIMTGKHQSRPIEEIIQEVEWLASQGVKELQVIAQDLTYYGRDLYKQSKLAELIDRIANVDGIQWVRLHYAYPTDFPLDILPIIRENKNVCKYLDIALQHISDHMLSDMRRGITKKGTLELIETIRKEVPGIHLRTTLIAGHPNETEEDFQELIEFVKQQRFERLGVFPYSHEEGTYAYQNYQDNIDDETKQFRMETIMEIQEKIALEANEEKIGRIIPVLIDRLENNYYIARSEFDSPEVDPEILIKNDVELRVGEFYNVKINEAMPFELFAEIIK